ncbi:MAG: response regulator [Bdellovibrio sp.]
MSSQKSILIVEDDLDLAEAFKQILCGKYSVSHSSNGMEALSFIHEKNPDIVITDVQMPVMNGIEMLEELKKRNLKTNVLVLTGKGEASVLIRALKLGVLGFMEKPITIRGINEAVESALNGCSDSKQYSQTLPAKPAFDLSEKSVEDIKEMSQEFINAIASPLTVAQIQIEFINSTLKNVHNENYRDQIHKIQEHLEKVENSIEKVVNSMRQHRALLNQ